MKRSVWTAIAVAAAIAAVGCDKKTETAPAEKAPGAGAAAPAPPAASDPVAAVKAAIEATEKCEAGKDGVRAKDESACTKPIWDAYKDVDDPKVADDQKEAKRKAYEDKLSSEYALLVSHKSRTVVFYALFQSQTRFKRNPPLARFEQLMGDDHAETAEWAAIARFWKRDGKVDPAALELAKATVKAHKHERVRLSAMQVLQDASFKGNKEIFDLALSFVKNASEASLVRSSGLTTLGYIGADSDIKTIVGFCPQKDLQYSCFYALNNGMATTASFGAAVGYVAGNAKKADKIFSNAMNIFVPFESQWSKWPKDKAIKALAVILVTKEQHEWTRSYAARDLGKLKAKAELEKAKAFYEKSKDPKAEEINKAITEALAKAG